MKKRNIFLVTFILAAILCCYYFGWLPIVFATENNGIPEEINLNKGASYNPLNEFDFENGNYELYYIQSPRDKNGFFSVLHTDNKIKLKIIKNSFYCTYTGGDIATYESRLILVKDKRSILSMYINLNDQPFGVQDNQFGWLTVKDKDALSDELNDLDAYTLPFLSF